MATATIKVNRVALIAKLEEAGKALNDQMKAIEKSEKDYHEALNKWAQNAVKHREGDFRLTYSNRIEFSVKDSYLTTLPQKPSERLSDHKDWKRSVGSITRKDQFINGMKEISNTLAVLALSTEVDVPQSIYKSVAQYLG